MDTQKVCPCCGSILTPQGNPHFLAVRGGEKTEAFDPEPCVVGGWEVHDTFTCRWFKGSEGFTVVAALTGMSLLSVHDSHLLSREDAVRCAEEKIRKIRAEAGRVSEGETERP